MRVFREVSYRRRWTTRPRVVEGGGQAFFTTPDPLQLTEISCWMDEEHLEGEERSRMRRALCVLDMRWRETWFEQNDPQ